VGSSLDGHLSVFSVVCLMEWVLLLLFLQLLKTTAFFDDESGNSGFGFERLVAWGVLNRFRSSTGFSGDGRARDGDTENLVPARWTRRLKVGLSGLLRASRDGARSLDATTACLLDGYALVVSSRFLNCGRDSKSSTTIVVGACVGTACALSADRTFSTSTASAMGGGAIDDSRPWFESRNGALGLILDAALSERPEVETIG